jgi:hypothetical protein
MKELANILSGLRHATEESAEEAGFDCGKNGSNTANCHFKFFATRELTAAWERGKARAQKLAKPLKQP